MDVVANAAKKVSAVLDMGVLEKATVYVLDDKMKQNTKYKPIRVQFNPSSYSIRQGVRITGMQPVTNTNEQTQFTSISPESSFLMVQLVFDSYTEYGLGQAPAVQLGNYVSSMAYKGIKTGLEKLFKDDTAVYPQSLDVMRKFTDLIKINSGNHAQHFIRFVWGPMSFTGEISGMNVEYTMFARDGSPVRANMGLIIKGDEDRYMNQNEAAKPLTPANTPLSATQNTAAKPAGNLRP